MSNNTFSLQVDRHGNLEKLSYMSTSPSNLGLYMSSEYKRADQVFAQKSLYRIYGSFKTVLTEQVSDIFVEHVHAAFTHSRCPG